MRKILLAIVSVIACVSINAQVIKVYDNGTLKEMYTNTSTDKYKVIFNKEYKVTGITLNKTNAEVYERTSLTLTATVAPANASNHTLTWTSSDESVATVADGVVTAVEEGVTTITAAATDGSGVQVTCNVTVKYLDPNLLPGKFSVSATKQVQFTKSNLYWDGSVSAFKLEANQTDYPTSWDTNHVGHFIWTNITDYNKKTNMPYSLRYSTETATTNDMYWCGEDNKITVNGTSGLYVLSNVQNGSGFYYLINQRSNYTNLRKFNVTVTNNGASTICTIIAPDDFSGTLRTNYTLDEANSLGLVCLPAAGFRTVKDPFEEPLEQDLNVISGCGSYGYYGSSTPDSNNATKTMIHSFSYNPNNPTPLVRFYGCSIRLVKTIE